MEIKGKELDEWREQRNKTVFPDDPMLEKISALYFYSYSIGTGAVGVSTFEPIDNSKLEIIKKFRNVFLLSYRRFRDIVLAEKHAREAQIEAALERVRARSMAMLHSRELIEVVRLLDKAIKGLGIQFVDATQIVTDFSNPEEGLNIWITVEGMDYLQKFHVPYFDHPTWFMLTEALKKGQNFYTEKYLKAEKNRFYRLLFKYSDFGRIPKERQAVLLHAPGLVKSYVIHKNSILLFQHNGLNEFSAEDNAIFRRFGAVFEQSYTRFLDLQNAEAQARESEIQLALERVRARTMAMHKSNELAETAAILFQQMTELGVTPERLNICLINEVLRSVITLMQVLMSRLQENEYMMHGKKKRNQL
jgi:hypothetical protein